MGFKSAVSSIHVSFKNEGRVEEMAEDEELTTGWNHVYILWDFNSMIINSNS